MIGEREVWGKGYGTDAIRTRNRFAFEQVGLHRIEGRTFEFNRAMQRVYEKCEYHREGVQRKRLWRNGRWWDMILDAILDEEHPQTAGGQDGTARMSYYACVGFAVADAAEVHALASHAASQGESVPSGTGVTLRRWRAGADVELWAEVGPRGEVLGVLPFYDGGAQRRVAITAWGADPDHPEEGWIEGWIDPTDPGEPYSGAFPLVCDLVDFLAASPRFGDLPRTLEARIVGFLHEASVYEDELALAVQSCETGFRLPPYAFASTAHTALDDADRGDRPEATAMLSGRLLRVDRLRNPATGLPFWALRVDTQKAAVDLVAPAEMLLDPQPGQLLQGGVWMLARIPAFDPA